MAAAAQPNSVLDVVVGMELEYGEGPLEWCDTRDGSCRRGDVT